MVLIGVTEKNGGHTLNHWVFGPETDFDFGFYSEYKINIPIISVVHALYLYLKSLSSSTSSIK